MTIWLSIKQKYTMFSHEIDFINHLFVDESPVPLHRPYFSDREKALLFDCVDSTYVSSIGSYVEEFEHLLRKYTGSKYAIAVVNGTSALHVALKVGGVDRNDEVITQPFTFVATCNAISYCGAHPVFVDISKESLGMSSTSLSEFLQNNVNMKGGKAINKKS